MVNPRGQDNPKLWIEPLAENVAYCLGVFFNESPPYNNIHWCNDGYIFSLWEHKTKQHKKSFSARYNLFKLVYIEPFETIVEAIEREKYLKGKTRGFNVASIQKENPEWRDLADECLKVSNFI